MSAADRQRDAQFDVSATGGGNPVAHIGFAALKAKLATKGDVADPAAVAAKIGQQKYGKKGMAALAAKGKKKPKAADLFKAAGKKPSA